MLFRPLPRAAVTVVSVSALVMSGLPAAHAQTDPAEAPAHFTVSNITDFHGRWATDEKNNIPGALHLKCALDEVEGGDPTAAHAFTSSGDNIGASPFESMILDDAPTIDVLNELGLDVSTVGNHEFDNGAEDLTNRVVPAADWTYLAAGADGLDKSRIRDYDIMDLDGVKVAFVGGVTDDMPNLVSPAGIEGITWQNPVDAINRVADELTGSGQADVVIAMPHEGGIPASAWSDNVDVVFMGHTHEFVEEGGSHPVVLQAGSYSKGLANVGLSYDRASDAVSVDTVQLLREADLMSCGAGEDLSARYPELQATISAARSAAEKEGSQVIGQLDHTLYRGANPGEGSGSNRGVESQLNNLLANVAKWGVGRNSGVTPDIGVMNAGGVRADLEKGEVTYREAFDVQPFGNENTYITLKGSSFRAALEQQWKDPGASRPFLSLGVSDNVAYTYDETRPQGERITSVLIDGQPLDPDRDYIVAGSTFLLSGGDGFTAFKDGSAMANLGYLDIMAFREYLDAYLGGKDAPVPRTGQSNVAVHVAQPLKAGTDATIDLSSLIYTQGETASTVTVELGTARASAAIDAANQPKNLNEAGRATLTLAVPDGLSGEQRLRVTTDAGTDVWVPVTVEAGSGTPTDPTPTEPAPTPKPDLSSVGSTANPLLAIILAILGILGIGGLVALVAPQQFDRLSSQFPRF